MFFFLRRIVFHQRNDPQSAPSGARASPLCCSYILMTVLIGLHTDTEITRRQRRPATWKWRRVMLDVVKHRQRPRATRDICSLLIASATISCDRWQAAAEHKTLVIGLLYNRRWCRHDAPKSRKPAMKHRTKYICCQGERNMAGTLINQSAIIMYCLLTAIKTAQPEPAADTRRHQVNSYFIM